MPPSHRARRDTQMQSPPLRPAIPAPSAGRPDGNSGTGIEMPQQQNVPYGRRTQKVPRISEVHVLWLNDGMSCDGDSVSITAASDPSIEDIVLGAIPGLPKNRKA